jgi:hypothetical protein
MPAFADIASALLPTPGRLLDLNSLVNFVCEAAGGVGFGRRELFHRNLHRCHAFANLYSDLQFRSCWVKMHCVLHQAPPPRLDEPLAARGARNGPTLL